jgi:hypothetical protein
LDVLFIVAVFFAAAGYTAARETMIATSSYK